MARPEPPRAYRGALLRFRGDPGRTEDPLAFEYFDDGLLFVVDGRIAACGPAEQVTPSLPSGTPIDTHDNALLVAGFVDAHIHYPQLDVIAAGGQALLDWLRDYTFPEEAKFADAAHSAAVSEAFLDELMRNGTTTANVFCTVHAASVNAFFTAAERRGLRMIAGKVLMDSNAPAALLDPPGGGLEECETLLRRWHGRGRLHYAIVPRFAPTSSPQQLQGAGELAARYDDVHIHTHLAENVAEIAWVRELFTGCDGYLDVYARHGLLRRRSVFAHCIHLDPAERSRMAAAEATAAFCPSSNLYLGSGLFDLDASDAAGLRYAIATDVGGGSSFSLLRTLADAHKVAQLQGQHLPPLRAFYLASLGAARALDLDAHIGTLVPGSDADFLLLDLAATPLIDRRVCASRSLSERLRVLATLGDERCIGATFVAGRALHRSTRFTKLGGTA